MSASQNQVDIEKRFFTTSEFLQAYGISRSKLYILLRSGKLRAVKSGTRTLISVEEAERYAAQLPAYHA